jgi:hypothetical protein
MAQAEGGVRVTATISKAQQQALEQLARRHDVSVAWLIRRAIDRLIEEAEGGPRLPLDLG